VNGYSFAKRKVQIIAFVMILHGDMMVRDMQPKTTIGKAVRAGTITSIDEIFESGQKIREPWIVDALLPNLGSEIILFGGSPGKGGGISRTSTRRTVRMHRSGRRYRISALVAVGSPGYIGLGKGTANEHSVAINKAAEAAKLNVIPIKTGCGSWECGCGEGHTIPLATCGKNGSVRVKLMPAPKGIGLCVAAEGKKMLNLAGIRDLWSKAEGQTQTRYNYVWAIYNAFKKLNSMKIDLPEAKSAKAGKVEEKAEAKPDESAELEAEEIKEAIAEKEISDAKKPDAVARPEIEGGIEVEE